MMKLTRAHFILALATLTLMALSLGLSFAHLMEAPPRLGEWPGELWRETTVFRGQYFLFGVLGGPIDVGSVVLGFALAYRIGKTDKRAFRAALFGGILFLAGLLLWFAVVAPVNAQLATWQPGPLPENFEAARLRWEAGHIVIALIKLAGFILTASSTLLMRRR